MIRELVEACNQNSREQCNRQLKSTTEQTLHENIPCKSKGHIKNSVGYGSVRFQQPTLWMKAYAIRETRIQTIASLILEITLLVMGRWTRLIRRILFENPSRMLNLIHQRRNDDRVKRRVVCHIVRVVSSGVEITIYLRKFQAVRAIVIMFYPQAVEYGISLQPWTFKINATAIHPTAPTTHRWFVPADSSLSVKSLTGQKLQYHN